MLENKIMFPNNYIVCRNRFSSGLPIFHEICFGGSLIPLPPFGGRNAIQFASKGGLVVQCWPDYKVANRLVWFGTELPSKFLRQHAHLSSNIRGKRKKKREPLSKSGNIFPQPIQRYFSLEGRQTLDNLSPFIELQKPVFG